MTIEFYGYDGQERLSSEPEDVVIDLITGEEDYQGYPIKVHVFKPIEIIKDVESYVESMLDTLLENLDEEYGDPDNDYTEPTEKIKKSALDLARTIKEEYVSWMCEPTGEVLEFSKEDALKIVGER